MSSKRRATYEGHAYPPKSRRKHVESPDCWCEPIEITVTARKKIFLHKCAKTQERHSVILNTKTGEREVLP